MVALNVTVVRVQRQAKVSKETTLLDGFDLGPPNWRVYVRGLNHSVHEGMKGISNVKVHLKTHSGNVNIKLLLLLCIQGLRSG